MRPIRWLSPLAALMALTFTLAPGLAAPRKSKAFDTIWVHPEFARFRIDRIAVLPIATFDSNYEAEKLIEQQFGQTFRGSGYRWIAASSTRDILRSRAGGTDSLVHALKARLLEVTRVDSLEAPVLCGQLHASAVLSLRVEQWERQQVEWNQSGKPFTQVQLRAALVDSLGHLLWSVSGSSRGEGSYNDPNANAPGITVSGLDTKPITAQAGAPSFSEVLLPLLTRWAEAFPSRSAPDSSAREGKH